MKIFNEFNIPASETEIKKLIIKDLVAKIGWIRGNYPNKVDSVNNLDILFRHLAFEDNKESEPTSTKVWNNDNEIYSMIINLLPISKYFFGKNFPTIKWFINSDDTLTYTLDYAN